MKEHLDELANLAADLRAVLEAETLRGLRAEPDDVPLPEAIAPDPEALAAEAERREQAAAVPEASSAWSTLARQSREERPPAALQLREIEEGLNAGGGCRRCDLCRDRRNIVFGVGSPDADLVVVGEAPGYHEDQKGEPFVGPAGEMLDKMLANVIGLERHQSYILNVVKCRPPKNRNPLPAEVDACRPFLERQIDAIQPKLILLLGSVALRSVFGAEVGGITRARGTWLEYRGIPVMPTFHPAYLLRKPEDKRYTFADLKAVKARYDEVGGAR